MTKFKVITTVLSFFILFSSCSIDDAGTSDFENVSDDDIIEQSENDGLSDQSNETDEITDTGTDKDIFSDTDTDGDSETETCEKGEGIYTVTGTDNFGNYAGTVQIYGGKFIRIVTYSDLSFENKTASLVLTGTLSGDAELDVTFSLETVGFIESVGEMTRTDRKSVV